MDESVAQLEQRATSEAGRKMINKTKADIAAYRTSRTALVNASSVAGLFPSRWQISRRPSAAVMSSVNT